MTGRIEKTVFISYRRTNLPWALAIFQNLKNEGYDVFFDYLSIPSGDFENIIVENIKARAHFVVILTPSALERCNEPGDWLRREIETAMDEKRNIVPLMLESFDFGSSSTTFFLTGKLEKLKKYNGLRLHSEYFFEGMDRLRKQYLNVSLATVIHPISEEAKPVIEEHQVAASEANPVEKEELTAQEWYERAYVFNVDKNYEEAIRCSTNAINLQTDFAGAYFLRGATKYLKTDHEGALSDFDRTLSIEPKHPGALASRAVIRESVKDWDGAIADYTEAIQVDFFDPNIIAGTYQRRGNVYFKQGNADQAIKDFTKAIELAPNLADYYVSRGLAHIINDDFDTAIIDFNDAIKIEPDNFGAYFGRGSARMMNEDLQGAIVDLNKALDIKPNDTDVYELRALIHEEKNEWENAIADYQKCLDLDGGEQNGKRKEIEKKIKKLKNKLSKKKSVRKKKTK